LFLTLTPKPLCLCLFSCLVFYLPLLSPKVYAECSKRCYNRVHASPSSSGRVANVVRGFPFPCPSAFYIISSHRSLRFLYSTVGSHSQLIVGVLSLSTRSINLSLVVDYLFRLAKQQDSLPSSTSDQAPLVRPRSPDPVQLDLQALEVEERRTGRGSTLLCHPPRQRLRLYSDPDLLYPTEEAAGTSGRFLLDPDLDPDDDLDLDPEKASSSHDLGLRRTLAQLLPPLPAGEPARLPRRSRRSSRLFGRPRRLLRGEDEHVQGSRRPRSLSLRMSAADQALAIQPLRSRTFPIPVPTLSPIPSLYLSSLHIDLALFYPFLVL
jgi:hypothetical protein